MRRVFDRADRQAAVHTAEVPSYWLVRIVRALDPVETATSGGRGVWSMTAGRLVSCNYLQGMFLLIVIEELAQHVDPVRIKHIHEVD